MVKKGPSVAGRAARGLKYKQSLLPATVSPNVICGGSPFMGLLYLLI